MNLSTQEANSPVKYWNHFCFFLLLLLSFFFFGGGDLIFKTKVSNKPYTLVRVEALRLMSVRQWGVWPERGVHPGGRGGPNGRGVSPAMTTTTTCACMISRGFPGLQPRSAFICFVQCEWGVFRVHAMKNHKLLRAKQNALLELGLSQVSDSHQLSGDVTDVSSSVDTFVILADHVIRITFSSVRLFFSFSFFYSCEENQCKFPLRPSVVAQACVSARWKFGFALSGRRQPPTRWDHLPQNGVHKC